ncbi:unnamed protein product [Bursaphelenchus okinawaensis]|uniref:PDZ domain-containing protein n=1 Tax=Bursaphelenchus okinawaensis TaxID=465554 RepID=A0A811LAM8_9BILA|nr:unnamed protein product [Bursaphelenchus okinawaensis]CAG9120048.1 unnamed protein product [Bursaphelenchus okinawaensis]
MGDTNASTRSKTIDDEPEPTISATLVNGNTGLTFDSEFLITAIDKESPFHGKVKVGDKIAQINDSKVENEEDFKHAIAKHGPNVTVTLAKSLKASQDPIPENREKNLKRQEGYTYHLAKIDFIKGCKFGLGIKHFQNKVLVTRVDPGSLSAKSLVAADRIVDVNGKPVTDKDVARALLLQSLKAKRTVSLLIERPFSKEAKEKVTFALSQSEAQPPSVAMASDIQEIIKKQKNKMEQKIEPKKSALRKGNKSGAQAKVQMKDEKPNVLLIASDHEGKALKPVKQETKPENSSS